MDRVWFVPPALGHVRISTVVGAALVFLLVLGLRRRPLLALVAVNAWLSVYEIAFNGLGIAFERWPVNNWDWVAASLLGWVVASWLIGIRPDWRWSVLAALTMALWVALGYHSNIPAGRPWSVSGEVLNEISKSALGLAFLLGALRLRPQKKDLMKEAQDVDGVAGVRGRLHLHRVGPGRDG